MLYQLHWQERGNPERTEFVAQAASDDFSDGDALMEHFKAVIERRKAECPEGWIPLLMDEGCPQFVWASDTPAVVAAVEDRQ